MLSPSSKEKFVEISKEPDMIEAPSKVQKDALVVYFSRTGRTKIIAEKIAKYLGADIKEIVGSEDFSSLWGALKLSYRVLAKTKTQLKDPPKIEACYKTIWIGSPVHASSLASPLYTWICDNKDALREEGRKISLFATGGGMGYDGMFSQAETLIGVKATNKIAVFHKDAETFDPEKALKTTENVQEDTTQESKQDKK